MQYKMLQSKVYDKNDNDVSSEIIANISLFKFSGEK